MGSGGGVWDTEDGGSAARLNQKTILVDTGANINSATTYAGMFAYCTTTGSGFTANIAYMRNAANTAWVPLSGVIGLTQTDVYTNGWPTSGNANEIFYDINVKKFSQITSIGTTDFHKYTYLTIGTALYYDAFGQYASQGDADTSWPSNDTAKNRVNVTNDNLAFDCVGDNSNDSISHDFGAGNVSDTKWLLRFKITFTTLTATAAGDRVWVGLSDASYTAGSDTAQDFVGITFAKNDSSVFCSDANGTNLHTDDSTLSYNFTTTTYYVEIKRTSDTAYTCTLYSDAAYSTSLATANGTIGAGTISGLRYLVVRNYKATAAGEAIGTIDEVFFANGVSSL